MHILIDMLELARKEFERNLEGLTDGDARKRLEPMNCISWIIAHVANQHHAYFTAFANGKEVEARYRPYGYGQPASQPSLEEATALWRAACADSQAWLAGADDTAMKIVPSGGPNEEDMGALTVRCIFHTWDHLGEISSIRQILGHKPPQFVNMYGWKYGKRP